MLAIIIMGSPTDREFTEQITQALDVYDIPWELRIASAHKTPAYLLRMLTEYEQRPQAKVFITVAGRSNALSGMVDAAVQSPVIACPPYSSKFAGADIFSSLRTPSGVAPALVLEPKNAALLAAKVLGLTNPSPRARVAEQQQRQRERLHSADQSVQV